MCDLDYGYMGFTRNIIKIKGKTYQNLVDENNVVLGNYSYNAGTGEYSLTNPETNKWNEIRIGYTRPVYNGEKLLIRFNIIKNTIVTTSAQSLKISFSGDTNIGQEAINISNNYTGIFEFYCNSAMATVPDNIRISSRAYKSGELVIKDIQVIPLLSNPLGSTELPTSINGIESACENENNVLLLKDNSITLPQPLRSLPNGVCDELVGNKLIQRVGKLFLNENSNVHRVEIKDSNFIIRIKIADASNKYVNDTSTNLISDKFIVRSLSIESSLYGICAITQAAGYTEIRITQPTSIIDSVSEVESENIAKIKEWLKNNTTTVYYELASPVETTINVNIKKIKKSKCYNKIKPTII